ITSYIEEKQKGKFLSAMKNARGFFQKVLAEELKLRVTPKIVFIWDENYIKAVKVNELIDRLAEESKLREQQKDVE
ncbi:MAG: ribosome-binding factor A, partial [Leptospiraceae bacterium]|nr:ribosome-binding factor A [Leptospiraceae bacterium]